MLLQLSSRVDLSRVGEVLRLYCKALTGTNVSIHPVSYLAEKGIGWVSEDRPSTEGTTVYLPEFVEEYVEREMNFSRVQGVRDAPGGAPGVRKLLLPLVCATKQPLQSKRFEAEAERLASGAQEAREKGYLTEMERFFDLFDDRQLASDIFAIAEDTRIDTLVRREYGGIRKAWSRTMENELESRALPNGMPLRQAFVENLVRASLDGSHTMIWPRALQGGAGAGGGGAVRAEDEGRVDRGHGRDDADPVRHRDEDPEHPRRRPLGHGMGDRQRRDAADDDVGAGRERRTATRRADVGQEVDYESPDQVDFRGDFKPELVQLLMRLRMKEGEVSQDGTLSPLTQEQLMEMLEKSVEITIGAMAEGDLASTIGLFLTNLEKEAGTPIGDQDQQGKQEGDGGGEGEEPEEQELTPQIKTFLYDEWDFRAADYKPRLVPRSSSGRWTRARTSTTRTRCASTRGW